MFHAIYFTLFAFCTKIHRGINSSKSQQSLVEPGVVRFEECLEGDTHVLVLILLSKLVAELPDAVLLEALVELLLLAFGHAEHVVRVDLLGLFPEIGSLGKNVATDIVNSFVVLYHQVALEVFGVGRAEHDNSVR